MPGRRPPQCPAYLRFTAKFAFLYFAGRARYAWYSLCSWGGGDDAVGRRPYPRHTRVTWPPCFGDPRARVPSREAEALVNKLLVPSQVPSALGRCSTSARPRAKSNTATPSARTPKNLSACLGSFVVDPGSRGGKALFGRKPKSNTGLVGSG